MNGGVMLRRSFEKNFMRTVFLLFTLVVLVSGVGASGKDERLVCLNAEEMKLYYLLMEYRESRNLERISLSSKLSKVAQLHAQDLEENFDPRNGKCNIHSWSRKGNWKSCCYTDDHKEANCMWNKPREITGYAGNGFEISYSSTAGATAAEGLAGWRVSPGHNQVIVNEGVWKNIKWKAIGIGIYENYAVVWFGEVEDESKPEGCL